MKYSNYKFALTLLTFLLLFDCKPDTTDYINHLEGYWEIESVILNNGEQKDYKFSNTIDFISINDSLNGKRKKLKPNFNGTFETSKNSESFTIKFENDSINMYYETPFDNWKETVLKATETQLTIINANNVIYNYKRYKPINLNNLN
ncbi:hypothetical protein [Hanstruepera ponticola]|uniref:hypothetical protein n=1 Tax=Hanstruepera ponticola TaxID=2042995 RepID=UPI000CF033A1|nr:hypothetical protein [Hanstruepera ponticola]